MEEAPPLQQVVEKMPAPRAIEKAAPKKGPVRKPLCAS